MRIPVSLLIFVAVALAWLWLVGAVGIWWTLRHPPAPAAGTDTYFIMSSWVFRLAVIHPLISFQSGTGGALSVTLPNKRCSRRAPVLMNTDDRPFSRPPAAELRR